MIPSRRGRRVRSALKRVVVVVVLCTAIPVGYLFVAQDSFIYLPTQQVPPIAELLPGGEVVVCTAADRIELTGSFVDAADTVGRPAPTVVMFHGQGGNRATMAWFADELAASGYSVFLAEYRGFGGMDGKPSEAGLRMDAQAAIDVVEQRPGVDPDRIVYLGHSLGTAVAVDAATRNPSPGAVVLLAPFTSLPAVAWNRLPLLPYPALMRDHYDSLSRISDIGAPLLVVGGADAQTVPAAHGRPLFGAADEPRELVMVEGADHDLIGPDGPGLAENVIDYLDRTVGRRPLKVHATEGVMNSQRGPGACRSDRSRVAREAFPCTASATYQVSHALTFDRSSHTRRKVRRRS